MWRRLLRAGYIKRWPPPISRDGMRQHLCRKTHACPTGKEQVAAARSSNRAVRHAPLDWRAISGLDNTVELHHVSTGCNPKMRRDIFGGWGDADAFRGAPKR